MIGRRCAGLDPCDDFTVSKQAVDMTGRNIRCAFFLRSGFLAALLVTAALPLSAQTHQPRYLREADHVCKNPLPDGTAYERWDRVFLTAWQDKPLYVKLRAYYRPGYGEVFLVSTGLSEHGYMGELKEEKKEPRTSCEVTPGHILIFEDGEWVDFWAERGKIVVFHCHLKFDTREKAWDYIAQHWRDADDDLDAKRKWTSEIFVYDQLGREFFRPKRLEFDARPYSYNSLGSVKKAGSNWELEIKGADEPNRATVLLDSEFKIFKVTKIR